MQGKSVAGDATAEQCHGGRRWGSEQMEGLPLDVACGAADTLMAYVTGSPQRREPKRNHWPIRIRLAYKLALRPGVQAARDRVNLLRRARA
jgi:hypothetical protein